MNRAFSAALAGLTFLLALFLIGLILSTVVEMNRTGFTHPPKTDELLFAIRLSLTTSTLAAILAMMMALPVAYFLSRYRFTGRIVVDTLLDLPMVISPIALGAMLLVFFNTGIGQRIEAAWGPFVFDLRGIILAQFLVIIGLAVRMVKNVFDHLDPEYEDLARTLGCNRAQAFFYVVLPLSRRSIAASFLLVWARAVGEFGATVTVAGAMPFKTATIPVAIYLSYGVADISSMMALILVAIAFALGLLFLMRVLGAKIHV